MYPFFITLVLIVLTGCSSNIQTPLDQSEWDRYQQRFLSPEGRIIDTGNGNVSHSEGQGYGMLLAFAYQDKKLFERIWGWTKQHLQIREDHLLAWQWIPTEQGGVVKDRNNASDGDLLIAWALARAGKSWQIPAYSTEAKAIAQDIRTILLRKTAQGMLLLPGAFGFEKATGLTVNLSYWVFPALKELQQLDPAPEWEHLQQTGLDLLHTGRFGRWQLPPDWLVWHDNKFTLSPDFKPTFGYNAIRIPLYLIWAKRETAQNLQPFLDFWQYFDGAQFTPAWTNLQDDSVDSYNAPAGIQAIMHLTRYATQQNQSKPPPLPSVEQARDYYSASLLLLTKVVLTEGGLL
jgi:endoglucanase